MNCYHRSHQIDLNFDLFVDHLFDIHLAMLYLIHYNYDY